MHCDRIDHALFTAEPPFDGESVKEIPNSQGIARPFWNPRDGSIWGVKDQRMLMRFDGANWGKECEIPEEDLPPREKRQE